MTSRIPPSRRAPEFAAQRAARAVQQQTPGAGRVAGAARPAVNDGVQAALRGRVSSGGGTDSTHPGTGVESTAVGDTSVADDYSTSLGVYSGNTGKQYAVAVGHSSGGGDESVTVGEGSYSASDYIVSVGRNAVATSASSIALGWGARTEYGAQRSIAIGAEADVTVSDRALIKANDLEVARSDGTTGPTGLRLYDEDGTVYVLGVHRGPSAPTNGCLFWYDTDATC